MARRPRPWFRTARDCWFVTIDGVQHNLGPDKQAAYNQFFTLMRQPASTKKVAVQSLVSVIDAFLDWTHENRAAKTFEWYRFHLQRFADAYPDLRLAELRPFHVQRWMDSYDISWTSKRNHGRAVKRCVRWARRQGYADSNPIADLELPSAQTRELVIAPEEFDRLLSFTRDESFRELLVVTWETGCRPQESLRVKASYVDSANQRWVFPRSESKGKKKSRVVYLTDRAMEITERAALQNPTGPIFRNAHGKSWTPYAVNCAFCRLRARMGTAEMKAQSVTISQEEVSRHLQDISPIRRVRGTEVRKTDAQIRSEAKAKLSAKRAAEYAPKYSLYTLRHSWATNALQRGMDAVTVGVLMGHSDPSMVARVYQHLSQNPQHMLEQAKKAVG